MWEAFVVGLVAGIAASPHCLGMCGGFPLHLAKPDGTRSPTLRQLMFVLGKAFTYVFLGALAGAIGVIIFKNPRIAPGATTLRLAAGSLTVLFGLIMLGFRLPPIKALQGIADTGIARALLGGLLDKPGPASAMALGIGVGFLPCPLPMGMLAVAAASHNVVHGMVLMAGVGLGSAPVLIAVGILGIGLSHRFTRVGIKAAGLVVLIIGLMTIGRAAGAIHGNTAVKHAAPGCCDCSQK